jgi:hypothetical protein
MVSWALIGLAAALGLVVLLLLLLRSCWMDSGAYWLPQDAAGPGKEAEAR